MVMSCTYRFQKECHSIMVTDTVLKINVPMHGTKQAIHCFCFILVQEIKEQDDKRSKADPCGIQSTNVTVEYKAQKCDGFY